MARKSSSACQKLIPAAATPQHATHNDDDDGDGDFRAAVNALPSRLARECTTAAIISGGAASNKFLLPPPHLSLPSLPLGARLAPTAVKKIESKYCNLPTNKPSPCLRPLTTDGYTQNSPAEASPSLSVSLPADDRSESSPFSSAPKNFAMDRPYYYRSAEDVVPRDAVYVIVCGSVRVVPPETFSYYPDLERVEFQEGVQVIGRHAFRECSNLARVDFPSSLRTIEDFAFDWCERLSEVNLAEGLRKIGEQAFRSCAFERITVPSSVVEIGEEAFARCDNLEGATLAGGMVLVARGAFFVCRRLERIAIPSMAIVVKAGEDGNGTAVEVTGEIERDLSWVWDERDEDEGEDWEPSQLILTSRYLALMSQEDRMTFTDAINQLNNDQTRGAGPLELWLEGVADPIRHCFADCLAEYKMGIAAVLELALWKANMNQRMEASQARAAGGEKRARVDAPGRDHCRRTCGADIVIGPVLSYLWGPHRRADQEENRGSIQI